jgi:filamentous hemagglutinin family protein
VTFEAPTQLAVGNVIARITGGRSSSIDGQVCLFPGANFFLINPAGIVIGPNAQLKVSGGSIGLSSADYLRLSDGTRFFARLGRDGTLTTAAPTAFGFLPGGHGTLSVAAADATAFTARGHTISLVGGDVQITGGQIRATGGRVNLVAAASTGEVVFNPTDINSQPDVSSLPMLGAVLLRDDAMLASVEGGHVAVLANTLQINRSTIDVGTRESAGGGAALIARSTMLIDQGKVIADSTGPARGGAILLQADSIRFIHFREGLAASSNSMAGGPGGDITIRAGDLLLTAGASIGSIEKGAGGGGVVSVVASRAVTIDGTGSVDATEFTAETAGTGRAGIISIVSPRLDILNSGKITSTTKGPGPGGGIVIATSDFTIDGRGATFTGLEARVGTDAEKTGATGAGGRIDVRTDTLTIVNGGVISGSTFGRGPAGDVTVTARDVLLSGPETPFAGVFSRSTQAAGGGPGGNVTVTANSLRVVNGAELSTSTTGDGPAGNVVVAARDVTLDSGGRVESAATATGPAGSVSLFPTRLLEARNGAMIAVSATTAVGGNVRISDPRRLVIDHSTVAAQSNGNGGNVTLNARDLQIFRHATVNASAGGKGGQVSLDPRRIVLDHSTIDARSGGSPVLVQFHAAALLASDSRLLTNGGTEFPFTDIAGSLALLPAAPLAGNATLLEQCAFRLPGHASSFVLTGRGGQPPEPNGWSPATAP